MTEKEKIYNFAYKCIYFDEGLLLIFSNITPFTENDTQISIIENNVYIFFGNNVAYLSPRAIEHLKKANKIFLTASPIEYYENDIIQYVFEIDLIELAKVEGALLAISQKNSIQKIND